MNKKVRMFQALLIVTILLLQIVIPIVPSIAIGETETIQFEDVNLYNAIKEKLGDKVKSSSDENLTITLLKSDIEGIKQLDLLYGETITNISGLEHFTNLKMLNLYSNQISDISAISGLTNLTFLNLGYNQISDISVISGLTNLTVLNLERNQISDISAISGLTNLTDLNLSGNQISGISAISGLTNLTDLNLRGNQISDISVISGLTNLTELYLSGNQISGISAISGLTNLTNLNLGYNQISDISAISGLTNLTDLSLYSNQISGISAISGLTNLTKLDLYENQISDISAISGLTNLTDLSLYSNQISGISAISGLTNLTKLYLYENQISDISAISELTNLTKLYLSKNQISDISAISGLTNLTYLDLKRNQISDISAISGLTKLEYLYLDRNQISEISAISGLTNLIALGLNHNQITKNISNTEEEIELPQIFIQAKDENSEIYTKQEYILKNCELIEDKTKVKLIDKKQNASVKISGGRAVGTLFTIVVESETPKTLDSIKITKAPSKVEYTEGESFNKTGMEVKACYSDGTEQVITNYTVTNGEKLAKNQTSVTISYTEGEVTKEIAQAITVKEKTPETPKTLDSIKITKTPSKVEYTEGESFNKTGMEVTACYSDGTEQVITNYTVTNGEKLAKNQTSVTISYTEGGVTKTATQEIKIQNKDNTTSDKELPNTGVKVPVLGGIVVMFITAIVSVIKIKRLSGI